MGWANALTTIGWKLTAMSKPPPVTTGIKKYSAFSKSTWFVGWRNLTGTSKDIS